MLFFNTRTPENLHDYTLPLLNTVNSRTAIEEAERYINYTPPYIPMSLYMSYKKDGNRALYENPFFEKRRALAALVLGEAIEKQGRFIDRLVDVNYSILSETTWTVSAHNRYERDAETEALPNTRRPIIDLFAAETAASLSVEYALLKDQLSPMYANMFQLIEDEIRTRIHLPYLYDHFWWMGNGHDEINNWGPWCTQNVLLSFFLLPTEQSLRKNVFLKALYTLDRFCQGYGDDGCCPEGAEYYRHAGLCMYSAMDIMDSVSEGALGALWKEKKVQNIASYIMDVHVAGPYFINYADCSARAGYAGVREFLFGERTSNKGLMAFAAKQWREAEKRERFHLDDISLFHRCIAFSHENRIKEYSGTVEKKSDIFFPSTGIVIAKKGIYTLACKGGNNGDSHNHNDIGSITLYKAGKPLLIDIGVEVYTAKTFSSERYDIWTMRSSYHNTVNFEGREQIAGVSAKAGNLTVHFTKRGAQISVDLEKAYASRKIQHYTRTLSVDGEEGLTVKETVESELPCILTLMSTEEPHYSREGVLQLGELGMVQCLDNYDSMETESYLIDDDKLDKAWGNGRTIYRTLIRFKNNFTWRIQ